jgi:hypothetical protein
MLHKAARTNCLADSCNHCNYNGEASSFVHDLTSCALRMLIVADNCRDVVLPCDHCLRTRPIIFRVPPGKKNGITRLEKCTTVWKVNALKESLIKFGAHLVLIQIFYGATRIYFFFLSHLDVLRPLVCSDSDSVLKF